MDASTQIGAYDVLFELAHGGMGAVYLGRAVGVGGFERLVAVKRLHLHLSGRADSVQRFLDEAAVAARIHHANVVSIHQVGSDEAGHFLVQDYVEGDTLQGLVDYATIKRRRLPPPIVLRIALDALAGLHAVHEATDAGGRPLGILHRDVSAQNLLVGRDGVTRLSDFGIAKHALSSVVTDGQYLQGRVLYMPPEYLARGPVDRRFDVYGMGVTLFLALAGDVPWPGAADAQIVHLATTRGIPPLSASGLAIAPAIEAIVARACQRDPAARFATARAMLEAFEELGRHTGWIASHGEVAAVVEELAGRELAARRAAVARARGLATGATPRVTVVSVPERKSYAIGRPALAAGALLVLLGAAALIAARRGGHEASPLPAPPAASVAPDPSGVAPETRAPASPAPALSSEPTASIATATPIAPTAAAPRAGAPPPRRTAEPRATPPPPPKEASDLKPIHGGGPAGDPAVITTANPYR
jgi:hypothetical protein